MRQLAIGAERSAGGCFDWPAATVKVLERHTCLDRPRQDAKSEVVLVVGGSSFKIEVVGWNLLSIVRLAISVARTHWGSRFAYPDYVVVERLHGRKEK